jgi:uncharacterized protein (DUF302 family)
MSASLVEVPVPADVATTVATLTAELDARGIPLFATVDHAAGARGVGLTLRDEVLLVFGNPAAGTPVMQADPRAGLDLPLRMLVWSTPGGTRVGFHDPRTLAEDYDLGGATATLDRLHGLLEQLARAATAAA